MLLLQDGTGKMQAALETELFPEATSFYRKGELF